MNSLPLSHKFYFNALNCLSGVYSWLCSMCELLAVKLREVNSTNEMAEALAMNFNVLGKILVVQMSKWSSVFAKLFMYFHFNSPFKYKISLIWQVE